LERRRKQKARPTRGSVNKAASGKNTAVDPLSLPHIAEFVEYGEITLGQLHSFGCVATACDGHNSLAMLVRREGETLAELLTRLDRAIAKAQTEDVYTDEINPS
jgi:hypothetical protein